jgi:UDP-GlcNAc:undecaprenyl-phosphate GlcNAc-1-phosphate transferase
MIIPYLSITIAMVSTAMAIKFLRPLALKINLVDHPSGRKIHKGSIPLIGGIAMFIGILLSIFTTSVDTNISLYMVLVSAIITIVGVLDDYKDLSVKSRFFFQIISIFIMITLADVDLQSLGDLVGGGDIFLHSWSTIFTLFAVIGIINAINMMDGIDGLAGGQSLVTFSSIAYLSYAMGNNNGLVIALLFCSVLIVFLKSNFRPERSANNKVFMGDGGSMFLGIILAWLLVDLSQGDYRVYAPVTALWLFAIPILDTITTMLRRIIRGQSPFKPDQNHIHHIIMKFGYTSRQALLIIMTASIIFAIIGIVGELNDTPQYVMFFWAIGISLVYLLINLWLISYKKLQI